MEWWLAYLATGAFVGFFAGLLGIGGGLSMVPILVFLFGAQDFPANHVMHLALGTAMTTIVFTAVSSLRAHHAHQAVRWDIVRAMTPGIVAGTLLGTALVGSLPSRWVALIFTAFVFYASARMWRSTRTRPTRPLPGKAGMSVAGGIIGGVSSLLAAGGAFMTVPFLTLCNVPMHHAIGTSAAVGLPIAIAGAVGYVLNGYRVETLPAWSLGFVYLPALLGIVAASVLTAPVGAKVAHKTEVGVLRKIFAVFLFVLAGKMATSLI
ncbi:MAG: sulfite exporter TauE/SafE family protein [Betaproteobacteria bacterium]|nr:sulfite exporter TauE/SafE family protein [Betaproteobacteria bacterium]